MRRVYLAALWVLAGSLAPLAAADNAAEVFKQAQKAEKAQEVARAYVLYSRAASLEPGNARYWLKAQSLRVAAVLQSPPKVAAAGGAKPEPEPAEESRISARDLAEARQPQPPVEVDGLPHRLTLELRGEAKGLYQRVAKAYGLNVVFDPEFQVGRSYHLKLVDADFREAFRVLGAATGSFTIPINRKLLLAAKDNEQKRREFEPTMAVVVPIPEPVSLQEAQELATAVRQVMEINKFQFDGGRRLALFRDRVSKVRPAQVLFQQLLHPRADVLVELEFLEVDTNSATKLGLGLPTTFPLAAFGDIANYKPAVPSGFSTFYTFGGGKSLVGLGAVSASFVATLTQGVAKTLLKADIRAADGQASTFHVGNRYPIITSTYSTVMATGNSGSLATTPSFNFEDLGLVLKLTPRVHSADEVSLEVEAEFKVLGDSSYNNIPVISNRKIQSRMRLKGDEWGILAGMLSESDARTLSGMAGLGDLPLIAPLLRTNSTTKDSRSVYILLKPQILSLSASERAAHEIWTGSETRPLEPM